MSALSKLDIEQEEPLASNEPCLSEALSREPGEEKWPLPWRALFMFSASLALWAMIIFVISQFL